MLFAYVLGFILFASAKSSEFASPSPSNWSWIPDASPSPFRFFQSDSSLERPSSTRLERLDFRCSLKSSSLIPPPFELEDVRSVSFSPSPSDPLPPLVLTRSSVSAHTGAGGLVSMPFVINGFVAAEIATGILGPDKGGWRWGYGSSRLVSHPPLLNPDLLPSVSYRNVRYHRPRLPSSRHRIVVLGTEQGQKARCHQQHHPR